MENSSQSFLTWKQVPAIISLIALLIAGGAYLYTKADKTELLLTEARCVERIDSVDKRVGENIKDIKIKQDKIYDLLRSIESRVFYYDKERALK